MLLVQSCEEKHWNWMHDSAEEIGTRKLEAWCKISQKCSLHFMMLIPSVSGFIKLRHLQWIGYYLPSEQTCKSEVLDNHASYQVSYCEEKVDCRRVMIMGHFGERSFTQRACNKTCDNCQNGGGLEHENRDVSQASPWLKFNMSPSSLLLYWELMTPQAQPVKLRAKRSVPQM